MQYLTLDSKHLLTQLTSLSSLRCLAIIACVLAATLLTSCENAVDSQDDVISSSQVPQVVQSAFAKKYPGKTPNWELQPYGYEAEYSSNVEITPQGIFYEVEVVNNGNEVELYFDSRGNEAPNSHEDA